MLSVCGEEAFVRLGLDDFVMMYRLAQGYIFDRANDVARRVGFQPIPLCAVVSTCSLAGNYLTTHLFNPSSPSCRPYVSFCMQLSARGLGRTVTASLEPSSRCLRCLRRSSSQAYFSLHLLARASALALLLPLRLSLRRRHTTTLKQRRTEGKKALQ